jgi:uncharacterized protein YndB with AHSA1/START domain
MIRREVLLPAGPDRVWDALTDPEQASLWLGGRIQWSVAEDAPLAFVPSDGSPARQGRVEEVAPPGKLSFRWWETKDGPGGATRVTYRIEATPEADTSILTVEEGDATGDAVPAARPPEAAASASAPVSAFTAGYRWGERDELALAVWMREHAVNALV